jgi:hypothetical protein
MVRRRQGVAMAGELLNLRRAPIAELLLLLRSVESSGRARKIR